MCHGEACPNKTMESHSKNVSSSMQEPPDSNPALPPNSTTNIASDKSLDTSPLHRAEVKRKRNGSSNGRGDRNNRRRKKRGDTGRGEWWCVTLRPLKVP